jgi:hypothetical protein
MLAASWKPHLELPAKTPPRIVHGSRRVSTHLRAVFATKASRSFAAPTCHRTPRRRARGYVGGNGQERSKGNQVITRFRRILAEMVVTRVTEDEEHADSNFDMSKTILMIL